MAVDMHRKNLPTCLQRTTKIFKSLVFQSPEWYSKKQVYVNIFPKMCQNSAQKPPARRAPPPTSQIFLVTFFFYDSAPLVTGTYMK